MSEQKSKTIGVYVSGATAAAWESAAEETGKSPSSYGALAIESVLRAEGRLPDTEKEASDLSLLRELKAEGIDITTLAARALREKRKESAA